MGYLTQKNNLLDESILTNITLEFNKDNIDNELITEVLNKTGLRDLVNSLPEGIDTHIGENGFAYQVVKDKELVSQDYFMQKKKY